MFFPCSFTFSFALSVLPSLLIQTGPIIFSVPAEYNGWRCLVSSGNCSHIPDKVADHSHTHFQTMKLKYVLKSNGKIKDEVIRLSLAKLKRSIFWCDFLVWSLFHRREKSQIGRAKQNIFTIMLLWVTEESIHITLEVEWPAGVCFRLRYVCIQVCLCGGETEPLQQGPRGSVLPSPALYEAVFWTGAQDQAWGTLLRSSLSRAPTLTDITSAGETQ